MDYLRSLRYIHYRRSCGTVRRKLIETIGGIANILRGIVVEYLRDVVLGEQREDETYPIYQIILGRDVLRREYVAFLRVVP
jgi:hypothetical protein